MNLGDRMKLYEQNGMPQKAMPLLPIAVRLDGKAFHSFCRGLKKPYDLRMIRLMQDVTRYLVEQTNACIGHTQSDEITLILHSDNTKSQVFFDGKRDKLISVICSYATYMFNNLVPTVLESKWNFPAYFDCRVWQVPNKTEACNILVWRELDAVKNSISAAAQSVFSHRELHGKKSDEMQQMLRTKDINWNDYPESFKRGTYFQRVHTFKKFTTEEMENLPKKHEARTNPFLEVLRSEVQLLEMPIFSKVKNREDTVFNGAKPFVGDSSDAENTIGRYKE